MMSEMSEMCCCTSNDSRINYGNLEDILFTLLVSSISEFRFMEVFNFKEDEFDERFDKFVENVSFEDCEKVFKERLLRTKEVVRSMRNRMLEIDEELKKTENEEATI